MATLVHGTTRYRAELILTGGPDPGFAEEPGGTRADGFSTYFESGPFRFGRPEDYACGKAKLFPQEGGAAIVKIEVPDQVIDLAVDEKYFPRNQGLVQFDEGSGLDELRSAWPGLSKWIVSVDCP